MPFVFFSFLKTKDTEGLYSEFKCVIQYTYIRQYIRCINREKLSSHTYLQQPILSLPRLFNQQQQVLFQCCEGHSCSVTLESIGGHSLLNDLNERDILEAGHTTQLDEAGADHLGDRHRECCMVIRSEDVCMVMALTIEPLCVLQMLHG